MNQKFTVAGLTSPEKINAFQPGDATVKFYSDPGLRARAFVIKFIAACIPLALIATGVTWLFSQSWAFGLVMFGVLAVAMYDSLSDHEAQQSPEWLERNRQNIVLQAHLHEVDSAAGLSEKDIQVERLTSENRRINQELLAVRAIGLDNSKYVPAKIGEKEPIPTPWPGDFEHNVLGDDKKTNPSQAFSRLLDFVADLYQNPNECLESDGKTINLRAVGGLPWGKRSDADVQSKREMKAILGCMYPRLFIEESDGRVWKLNLDAYPDIESALKKLNSA